MSKIIGLLDLVMVIVILAYSVLPLWITLSAAAYLIIKGLRFIFVEDFLSYVDFGIGIYLVLLVSGLSVGIITVGSVFFLTAKGFLSFS